MADRRRPSYYTAEEATMFFFGEKTTSAASVKMRKMNWNTSCKFLAKNRINFSLVFKFSLDSPVASGVPVISMK